MNTRLSGNIKSLISLLIFPSTSTTASSAYLDFGEQNFQGFVCLAPKSNLRKRFGRCPWAEIKESCPR